MNSGARTSLRLLVIGGAPSDLAVLQTIADAHGFGLDSIDVGPRLLETIEAQDADALFLDVQQRGASGHDLCAQLKADARLAGIPLILTGTDDGVDAHRRAYDAGCDDYVEKPFNRTALGYRVRALVRLCRAAQTR